MDSSISNGSFILFAPACISGTHRIKLCFLLTQNPRSMCIGVVPRSYSSVDEIPGQDARHKGDLFGKILHLARRGRGRRRRAARVGRKRAAFAFPTALSQYLIGIIPRIKRGQSSRKSQWQYCPPCDRKGGGHGHHFRLHPEREREPSLSRTSALGIRSAMHTRWGAQEPIATGNRCLIRRPSVRATDLAAWR